jgi:hypothetical protein
MTAENLPLLLIVDDDPTFRRVLREPCSDAVMKS